jgi:hypothetical protein
VGVGGGTYTRLEAADAPVHDRDLLDAAIEVLTRGEHGPDLPLGFTPLLAGARSLGVKGDDGKLRAQLREAASDPETALLRDPKRGFYLATVGAHHGSTVVGAAPRSTTASADPAKNRAPEPDLAMVADSTTAHPGNHGGPGGSIRPPGPNASAIDAAGDDADPIAADRDGAHTGAPGTADRNGADQGSDAADADWLAELDASFTSDGRLDERALWSEGDPAEVPV